LREELRTGQEGNEHLPEGQEPDRISSIIDLIASEYGWTLEKIYELTREELELLCKAILERKETELKISALGGHGARIETTTPTSEKDRIKAIRNMSGVGFSER
jgi:hypothetical protein